MSLADSFIADLEDIDEGTSVKLTVRESSMPPRFQSKLMSGLDRVRMEPSAERIGDASEFGPAADLEMGAIQLNIEYVY